MIDFNKYLEKHIVLVTNYTDTPEEIFGIRDKSLGIELFTINDKYACVRTLQPEDLKDEDFVQWLNTMWSSEILLINFIKAQAVWQRRKKH